MGVHDALAQLDAADQEDFWSLADSFQQDGLDKTAAGIFLTNAVGDDISRVYCWSSRANHSCQPNAIVSLEDNVRRIIAAQSISVGEEVCIPYIDSTAITMDLQASLRKVAKAISLDYDLLF